MTDKRFKPNYDGRLIIDTMTGDEYEFHSGAEEPVIELLNILHDENVLINKECERYGKAFDEDHETIRRLNKMDEQLRKRLNSSEKGHTRCDELYRELYEENESLKDEIKFLKNKVATYKTGNALLMARLDKERGYDG